MKNYIMKNIVVAFILLTLSFSGCVKDTIDLDKMPDPNRNLDFVAPIARIHFTMGEMIKEFDEDSLLGIDDDGLIYRAYHDTMSLNWESLVEIQNVSYSYSFAPPSQIAGLKSASSVTFQEKFKLNPENDIRYDDLYLESGNLSLNITAPAQATGTMTVSIPEVTLSNGQMLSYTFNVTDTEKSFSENLDLNDAEVHCSQAPDSSYITLNTEFDLNYDISGGIPGSVQLDLNVTDMKSKLTFGYFGTKAYREDSVSVRFDIYDEYDFFEYVELKNIELNIEALNYIGTPFRVEVEEVQFSKDSIDPQELIFYDSNAFDIATATYGTPIVPSFNPFKLDSSNTNIMNIVNDQPNMVTCNIIGMPNPDDTGEQNFLAYMKNLEVNMQLKFPFWFRTSYYSRSDTIDFNFSEDIDTDPDAIDMMEEIDIYFDIYNGLPFDLKGQVYVLDQDSIIIKQLFADGGAKINSGIPDITGKVKEATNTKLIVHLDHSDIELFRNKNAMYIAIETEGLTYNNGNPFVKVYEDNLMKISLYTNLNITLN